MLNHIMNMKFRLSPHHLINKVAMTLVISLIIFLASCGWHIDNTANRRSITDTEIQSAASGAVTTIVTAITTEMPEKSNNDEEATTVSTTDQKSVDNGNTAEKAALDPATTSEVEKTSESIVSTTSEADKTSESKESTTSEADKISESIESTTSEVEKTSESDLTTTSTASVNDKSDGKGSSDVKSFTLNDLTVNYSGNWFLSEDHVDSGEISVFRITNGYVFINIIFENSKIYKSSSDAKEIFKDEYMETEKPENITFDDVENEIINGETWEGFIMTAKRETDVMTTYNLTISLDYDVYSISYMGIDLDFFIFYDEAMEIINTAKINRLTDILGAIEAKKRLLGEWDCLNLGYFVLHEDDSFYLYKDPQMDMNNVLVGKVIKYSDKIPTRTAGYTEGYNIICEIYSMTVDGVAIDGPTPQLGGYSFVPSSNKELCLFINYQTENSGSAIKIK